MSRTAFRVVPLELRLTPTADVWGPFITDDLRLDRSAGSNLWQFHAAAPAPQEADAQPLAVREFLPLTLKTADVQARLAQAPFLGDSSPAVELALPKPDGSFARFDVWEHSVWEPGAAGDPNTRTYRGRGIDDPGATLVLTDSVLGISGHVLDAERGDWSVEPYYRLETGAYVSYAHSHLQLPHGNDGCGCGLCIAAAAASSLDGGSGGGGGGGSGGGGVAGVAGGAPYASLPLLRNFRIALAASAEYTASFGGVAGAQAAIQTAVNYVDAIFERDMSISLGLVANNNLLIYTDPDTDPFAFNTKDDNGFNIAANQANTDVVIGVLNYDVGQALTASGGGLAALASVGENGRKGRGTSGATGGVIGNHILAHELGHQFGAEHTFNNSFLLGSEQRNPATAVEPGSGYTIMSYGSAGGVDAYTDILNAGKYAVTNTAGGVFATGSYFHTISIQQMLNFVYNVTAEGGTSPSNNAVPIIFDSKNITIPANTPFYLTAGGQDADGDLLTYTWEQMDLGTGPQSFKTADDGTNPIVRSYPPTTARERYVPTLNSIVANGKNQDDVLPSTNRQLHFRVTVRDNHPGAGGVNTDDLVVNVVNTGAPFRLTSQTIGETWSVGQQKTITWDVAGTNAAPISAGSVTIKLSTDNGVTFPTVLAVVPNTGSTTITVPANFAASGKGRLMIDGGGFFDLSDGGITIFEDNYEPNDTRATAYNLTAFEGAYQSATPLGQPFAYTADWYRINVPAGESRLIVNNKNGNVPFRLLDARGDGVAGLTGFPQASLDIDLRPGSYFLSSQSTIGTSYDLKFQTIPDTRAPRVTFGQQLSRAPLPAGSVLLDAVPGVVVGFSEGIRTADAFNLSNYQLTRNGVDVSGLIGGVDYKYDLNRAEYRAAVTFTSPLTNGVYEFRARAGLTDWSGNRLDGNGDGGGPDDFVLPFTVSQVTKVGGETRVEFFGSQAAGDVATDAAGNFVAAWIQDGAVFARRFNAGGVPLTSAFRVDTDTPIGDYAGEPAVAVAPGGAFVVTYTRFDPIGFGNVGEEVFFKLYNAGGTAINGYRVNDLTSGAQRDADVAMDGAGNFIVAWTSVGQDGSGDGVYFNRFNANGTQLTGETRAHPFTLFNQNNPSIAADAAGRYVITFDDSQADDVYISRYTAAGAFESTERLNVLYTTFRQVNTEVAMNAAGEFVVTWLSGFPINEFSYFYDRVVARRFDANFSARDIFEFNVSESKVFGHSVPAVDIDPGGNFTVAYGSEGQDGSSTGIYARPYRANAQPLGLPFRVNTTTVDYQRFPSVAVEDDGDTVIIWEQPSGVYYQRYANQTVVEQIRVAGDLSPIDREELLAAGVNGGASLVVRFSQGMNIFTVQNVANYTLTGDGVAAPAITQATYSATTLETTLTIAGPLPAGRFTLTVSGAITDATGRFLDGDQDGTPGGSFSRSFRTAVLGVAAPEGDVNQQVDGDQADPAIAVDRVGNFAVAWDDFGVQEVADGSVWLRPFLRGGSPLADAVRVNQYTTGSQADPAVGRDAAGNTVVVWTSNGQDGSGNGIYARRYSPDGTPLSDEFRVNLFTAGDQEDAAVAVDANGNFVVVWESAFQDGSFSGVYARRFAADGTALSGEIPVNQTTSGDQYLPRVGFRGDGGFVITWYDGQLNYSFARRFGANGTALADEQIIVFGAAVESLGVAADGRFAVAWSSANDGSGTAAEFGLYTAAATFVSQHVANQYTTGNQSAPQVSVDADGDIVMTWQSNQDGGGAAVMARQFRANGAPVAGEFIVNEYTTGDQSAPSVAFDAAGSFAIAWQSAGQDGSGLGVVARSYSLYPPIDLAGVSVTPGSAAKAGEGVFVSFVAENLGTDLAGEFRAAFVLSKSPTPSDDDLTIGWKTILGVAGNSTITTGAFPTLPPRGDPFWTGDGTYYVRIVLDPDDAVVETDEANNATLVAAVTISDTTVSPTTGGAEIRVNETTAGQQFTPVVAAQANGGFVTAWTSAGQDGSGNGVFVRQFAADGSPLSGEIPVNTFTTGAQEDAAIAADAAGNFVVVWESESQDGSLSGVYARRFAANGLPLGGEFLVNQTTAGDQYLPRVGFRGDGGFVISWFEGPTRFGYVRRYDAAGTPLGGQQLFVNGTPIESLAVADDGRFVVSWTFPGDGDGTAAWTALADADGSLISFFPVNQHTVGNQFATSVAVDAAGNYVVAWQSDNQDGSGGGIYARRFDVNGVSLGDEFRVNQTTAFTQRTPRVSVDGRGDFVVTWTSDFQDGSNNGVVGRRYSAAGVADGGEFLVNGFTAGNQEDPAVASDAFGNFVIAWESVGQDGSGSGVYARQFGVTIPRLANFVVNGGDVQRSMVTSLTVEFDQIVELPADPAAAFQLKRDTDNAAVELSATVSVMDAKTYVTLTFTGGAVQGPSLADGRFTLTIIDGAVTFNGVPLDGNEDGSAGGSFSRSLLRLFGDADGNAATNFSDFLAFRSTFGLKAPAGGYNPAFDADADDDVDFQDFLQFRTRFGTFI